jgi:hypothetical protein
VQQLLLVFILQILVLRMFLVNLFR